MFRTSKLAMLVGEFVGTFLLTLVVISATSTRLGGFFTAIAAGATVGVLVLALARLSGAAFNPAVAIALWSARKLKAVQMLLYIIVQFAGAIAAWQVFVYLTKFDTSMIQHNGVWDIDMRVVLAELLGGFIFAFAIGAAVYQNFSLRTKAFTIGAGLTIAVWVAALANAGFINPALAFGLQQWNFAAFMIAPIVGAVIGINFYNLAFMKQQKAASAVEIEEAVVVETPVRKAGTTKSSAAKKPAAKSTAKPAAKKKAAAKKPVAKKKSTK